MLRDPRGEVGMRYLTGRKLTDETMHHFGLGYAGKNGEQVVQYLRKKGFTDEEIKDSGLAMFSEIVSCSPYRISTTGSSASAAESWETGNRNT